MTFMLFVWTAYVMAGVLVMLAVRCLGMWDPTHIHMADGYSGCSRGPADECPEHWFGRRPLPLWGWAMGTVVWPGILLLWLVFGIGRVLSSVASIRI